MPLPVSQASTIRALITRAQEEVFTALPAVVKVYDPVTMSAVVELAVKLVRRSEDGSPVYFECPLIPEVRVAFPRTQKYILSFPLEPGDCGILLVSTLDVGQWELTGIVPSEPLNVARQNISSCVFIPGWFSDVDPPSPLDSAQRATSVVLGNDGGVQIQIGTTDIKLGGTAATDYVALSTLVQGALDSIRGLFNAHVHGGVTTGPGSSGAPVTPIGALGPVAATKVKAL